MLKKKTIAALAASATLFAGFAFAAPAMAEGLADPLNTFDPLEQTTSPAPAPAPAQDPSANVTTYRNSYGTLVTVPGTKPLYDEATSGKFDDAPANQHKQTPAPCTTSCSKSKKLPKTGAAVALVAVVASALAGLGVAVRKFRH